MKTLMFVVGTLAALAMVTMAVLGVWTSDGRWGMTAYLMLVVAAAAFCTGSFLPKPVRHADKCGGC